MSRIGRTVVNCGEKKPSLFTIHLEDRLRGGRNGSEKPWRKDQGEQGIAGMGMRSGVF